MKLKALHIIFSFVLVIFASIIAQAQVDASTQNGAPRKDEDVPKNIKETLKKYEIERNKKDYEEMLERGEEAVKLSTELTTSYEKNNRLSSSDLDKLEKIEKIVKKIRNELGGDDDGDESEDSKPSTLDDAVESLHKTTVDLLDELKKTSRYSISVDAIRNSNLLIGIVRVLRFWKN